MRNSKRVESSSRKPQGKLCLYWLLLLLARQFWPRARRRVPAALVVVVAVIAAVLVARVAVAVHAPAVVAVTATAVALTTATASAVAIAGLTVSPLTKAKVRVWSAGGLPADHFFK